MNSLPLEILERILRYLPLRDQIVCEMIARSWFKIVRSFWICRNGVQLDNYRISVLVDDRVDASSIYEKSVNPALLNCIFDRFGERVKYFSIDGTSRFNVDFIAALPQKCPNLEHVNLSHICIMYNESEVANLPSLAPLVSLPTLRTLVLNSNAAVQVDPHNWSQGRQWAVGTVCPVVQLFPIGLDRMSANLTKLVLEDIMISTRTFISLCQRLAATLECLCLKLDDCTMQKNQIPTGLMCLTRLIHLNLGGRRPQSKTLASLLDNNSLEAIATSMNRLETLSIRGATNVSSTGVNALLSSVCGRTSLRYLNLNSCPKINQNISIGVLQRPNDSRLLTIYAYLTELESTWAQRLSGDNCKIFINAKDTDESVFWGEPKLQSLSETTIATIDNDDIVAANGIDVVPDLLSESDSSASCSD